MMSPKEPCPSRDQLSEVMRGKVASPQMELLAHHVESCSRCEETLQVMRAEDTFTDLFRSEAGKAEKPVEPVVKALIERMQEDGSPPSAATLDSKDVVPSSDTGTHAFTDARMPPVETLDFLAPPQGPDEIGRLGPYRVLKVLGKGGMGMVLMGHDPHLDRMAALKVMLPSIAANETAKQRFLREARTAAKLRSDHIVTIYQVSEDRGIPYLAMEYLEGAPLDKYMAGNRKLTVSQILRIAREITKGLMDAHERGLIHRDIKPGNIWLDQGHGGRATILDFGLARFDSDAHITQSGAIIGTPAFMAPEQARGEKVDARADLFSLGCVLYRLCAGDIPFKGETTMGVLMALAMNDPTPPAKINSQIPESLSELIMKLLEKDAAKRPATAREVMARLQQIEKTIAATRGDPQKIDATDMPTELTNVDLSLAPPMAEMASASGLMTVLEQAKGEPKPSAPPRQRRPIGFGALVLLGLLFLGGGGIFALLQMGVIRFSNEQGDYVIATDDPDFAFSVKKGSVILEDRKTKRKYDLKVVGGNKAAGELELEVTDLDADLAFKTKNFTIKRGQEVALKAWFERKQAAISVPLADRSAAEYVLSIGGIVRVNDEPPITAVANLPKGPFYLNFVDLFSNPHVIDADLARFKDCKKLRDINLSGTAVTDAGLTHFKNCEQLTNVILAKTKVTDVGLANFENCKSLGALFFNQTAVTDAGLKHFKSNCAQLTNLTLGTTAVTDAGLAVFKECKHLRVLILTDTAVTDAGLTLFHDCKSLTVLDVRKTKVTAKAASDFHTAVPGCRIEYDGGIIEPKASTGDDRKAAEYALSLGGNVRVNGDFRNLHQASELPPGKLELTQLDLSGTQVTDAGLAHFKDCKALKSLVLLGTKTTDTGIANFKNCKGLTHLAVAGTQVGDAGLANFKDCSSLRGLHLSHTKVTDAGLAYLKNCKDLEELLLLETKTTDAGLASFRGCKNLRYLDLRGTAVTDKGLSHFEESKELAGLILSGTAVTDAGLAYFKGCVKLTELGLLSTQVGDAGLAHLGNNKNLKVLDLGYTRTTDAGLALFKDCKDLTVLSMPNTQVGDKGLSHFRNCKDLKILNVGITQVTDAGLALFKDCTDLIDLTVAETKVSDAGLAAFQACKNLERLWLHKTQLSDACLEHFKACKKLEAVHLLETQMTDAALALLKEHKNLKYVNLTKTKITTKGIADFHTAVPGCKIDHDGGVIEPTPILADADRKAATRALELGASLVAINNNYYGGIRTVADLPKTPFVLTHLSFTRDPKLSDADLAIFQDCKDLKLLGFDGCPKVTDAGLAYFRNCKNLVHLAAIHTPITDAGLAHFKDCKLTDLRVAGSAVTDAGLAYFKDCKLKALWAGQLPVTDDVLRKFTDLQELGLLHLEQTKVTDAGLAHFKGSKKISDLNLSSTAVTDAGVLHLANCKDMYMVSLADTGIKDAGLAMFNGCSRVWQLNLNGTQVTDAGLVHLKDCGGLIGLNLGLEGTQVTGAGLAHLRAGKLHAINLNKTGMTDDGLEHLRKQVELKHVHLRKTKVTAEGVRALSMALPKCKIEWDGGVIEPTKGSDPNRQAVLRALELGASDVRINGHDQQGIKTAADLPNGPFVLTALRFFNNPKITDADLAIFKECTGLMHLELGDCPKVSDAGLAHFRACKNLIGLYLVGMPVTDAGLAHFKDCKLTRLTLSRCNVTAAGLAHFKDCQWKDLITTDLPVSDDVIRSFSGCKDVSYLGLQGTKVSDAGLAHFKHCKNITSLDLSNNLSVSDAGIAHFANCKDMYILSLSKTAITDAGLATFKDCEKLWTLSLGGTNVTDAGLAHLKNCRNLAGLGLEGTKVGDAGLEHLKGCKLGGLDLNLTKVTDAGLAHLHGQQSLTRLLLRKTGVTGDGVRALSKALPKCWIEWDGGIIDPANANP
jgi:serine/threonine protein kinase/uncharacterized membrane protein